MSLYGQSGSVSYLLKGMGHRQAPGPCTRAASSSASTQPPAGTRYMSGVACVRRTYPGNSTMSAVADSVSASPVSDSSRAPGERWPPCSGASLADHVRVGSSSELGVLDPARSSSSWSELSSSSISYVMLALPSSDPRPVRAFLSTL